MSVISWEDPPTKPDHDWVAIVAELRQRPGQWAHVASYKDSVVSSQIAHQLRAGRLDAARPSGSIEATARKVGSEHRVYARALLEGGGSNG